MMKLFEEIKFTCNDVFDLILQILYYKCHNSNDDEKILEQVNNRTKNILYQP